MFSSKNKSYNKVCEDNQSNFGVAYEYQFVNDSSIDSYMNENWIRFENNDYVG